MSKAPDLTALTGAQQQLVLNERATAWVHREVNQNVRPAYRRRYGREEFEQIALFALCESARAFDPVANPGVPFGAFARTHVRRRLWRAVEKLAQSARVNRTVPVDGLGEPFALTNLIDHRAPGPNPALALWCSDELRARRRCLDWRSRLVLCMRCVEGLTLQECALALRISKTRVGMIEQRAIERLRNAASPIKGAA
ncbi:MAG TPA: sigma factor-like helix-turn-helix DNA-binding protein [Gemmata sp.]